MLTRAKLAILLSKLEDFSRADPKKEQYMTDSEIASQMLWNAYMMGDIEGKTIADLGSGTGVLSIGCALLGAKKIEMVEIDKYAIDTANRNIAAIKDQYELDTEMNMHHLDMKSFDTKVDVVIENPPFGVQKEHADKAFLEKAMAIADVIYSIHKIESKGFIMALCKDKGFRLTHMQQYSFPLKQTMDFHRHKIQRIEVGVFRMERVEKQ